MKQSQWKAEVLLTHIPQTVCNSQIENEDSVEIDGINLRIVDVESGNSRYPRRTWTTSDRFVFHTKPSNEEQKIDQALNVPNTAEWKAAIDVELKALEDNKTWKAEVPPFDTHVIDSKLILTIKKIQFSLQINSTYALL